MAEFSPTINQFDRAMANGEAYRVSKRHTLADGEQLIAHFDPVEAGGTIYIETPAVTTPANCDIDIWENADPGTNTVESNTDGGLLVHATRYDVAPETPEAEIVRVTDGGLDTSTADKTEETHVQAGSLYNTPGGEARRSIWRIIPVGETVSFIVTDQSNGSGNVYGFDTMVYEGKTFPN